MSIRDFLTGRGYKAYPREGGDSDWITANYYWVAYGVDGISHCISNEKPPQLCVKEWYMPDIGHWYEISICNEAPVGWINFKVYGLNAVDVKEKINEIEASLLNAWETLFKEKTIDVTGEVEDAGHAIAV